jgi:hypothetical protein
MNLDHLDQLDDPERFVPDDAFRAGALRRGRRLRRRQRLTLVAGSTLATVLLLVGAAAAYAAVRIGQVERTEIDFTTAPVALDEPFNVLVVGSDHRAGTPSGDQRSDTMIVVRVLPAERVVRLLSLPRDLVEEAVLVEFERISERGGVLGAMELGYQRGKIQDESMLYEHKKHDGSLPIIGVNTFTREAAADEVPAGNTIELARSTDDEKQSQLRRLAEFQEAHADERPAALARVQEAALAGGNVFAELMEAARCCSLGEITDALFEVGGRYRRNV